MMGRIFRCDVILIPFVLQASGLGHNRLEEGRDVAHISSIREFTSAQMVSERKNKIEITFPPLRQPYDLKLLWELKTSEAFPRLKLMYCSRCKVFLLD